MTHNTFCIDIYNAKINVIIDDDWKEIARHVLDESLKKGLIEGGYDIDHEALTIRLIGNEYYMCFPKNMPLRNIYHECCHVMLYMAHDFNIEFDVNNQEPLAYLLDYLIEKTIQLKGENHD